MKHKYFFLLLALISCDIIYSQSFNNVGPASNLRAIWEGVFNGGGITFVDFDGDGKDDITMSGGDLHTISFYRNNGTSFDSVTFPGVVNAMETKTVLWIDFDNDGDKDLFAGSFSASSKLFRNDGNLNFTDITVSAGISTAIWRTTAAAWSDYNKDGWLDLYLCNYSGWGGNFWYPNILYKNNGNGTFSNVTQSAGVMDTIKQPLAVSFFDYNNDGWEDLYIANDRRNGNSMYKNNGNGTFTNVSDATNTDFEGDCMGLGVGDYDEDGDFDIYISNGEEGNGFLRNNGNQTFTEIASTLGMSVNKICWGNAFYDYNNDGWLDLYVCASGGAPNRRNELFKGNGNGTFTRIFGNGLETDDFQTYGGAIGDANNDGFPDMVCANVLEPISLWKNSGNSNNWIKIKLQGTVSNRDAVGSIIQVFSNGRKMTRMVNAGMSYCSQHSLITTVGVGTATTVDSIYVKFPSGIGNFVTNVNVNQQITIVESGVIGISNNNNSIPSEFALGQNYPNPFNPSTIIEYSVPKSSNVVIKLYNAVGVEVATLVNGSRSAGKHDLTVGENITKGLSSGIYFYKMAAGDFSATKKMILIK